LKNKKGDVSWITVTYECVLFDVYQRASCLFVRVFRNRSRSGEDTRVFRWWVRQLIKKHQSWTTAETFFTRNGDSCDAEAFTAFYSRWKCGL